MQHQSATLIELLAPAGSKEAFVAAIQAGADAVYIGVGKFNARLATAQFGFDDLQALRSYAHERKVKIYLALNTLIKQAELKDVAEISDRLARLQPDAVIVQDLGIARLFHQHHPEIPLHASTQLACHNLPGLETLATLGFCRAVLARELSLAELACISSRSPIELEVFCHGALCVSISGMCLFSSVIGGHSGNRGRCTQPCRRIWRSGGMQGYLFSPKDLQTAEYIRQLRNLKIAGVKIEGRMRSSEYVHTVVRAYRMLLSASETEYETSFAEACRLLAVDWAREKTHFYLSGQLDCQIFNPHGAQCLGKKIGKVVAQQSNEVTIAVQTALKPGDRIRISDQQRDITRSFTLQNYQIEGSRYFIADVEEKFYPGNPVFKAGDGLWDEKEISREAKRILPAIYFPPADNINTNPQRTKADIWPWNSEHFRRNQKDRLWITIDDPGWIPILKTMRHLSFTLICALSPANFRPFHELLKTQSAWSKEIIGEIPPFLSDPQLSEYQTIIQKLSLLGINRWAINNIGHLKLFSQGPEQLIVGPFLYTWNVQTAAVLWSQGARYFMTSWEDDFPNIRALAKEIPPGRLIVNLFGYVPVLRSRMFMTRTIFSDLISGPTDLRFRLSPESDMAVLWTENPVCLFGYQEKLRQAGIQNFGINLSRISPSVTSFQELYAMFLAHQAQPDSLKFNFKRGVR